MRDPYLYEGTETLINLFDERDENRLKDIEANYVGLRLRQLIDNPIKGAFDFDHLCKIHHYIFQDIYEWAGKQRIINIEKPEAALSGVSIEYSDTVNIEKDGIEACEKMRSIEWDKLNKDQKADIFSQCIAKIWKVHPFREGNTRTIINFFCDFVEYKGFSLNIDIFKDNSVYFRRALVAASAVFKDLGDLSQSQHLRNFIFDTIK
ncbi:MAG: Fic family protein [Elusimicrobiota bacterium]|jgi:cell filamentation protein|nr:Fic family protein [Elusimicrobiota bacterium]